MDTMKYLYLSERGFANEYKIYSISKEKMAEAKSIVKESRGDTNMDADFITRKEAERLTAHNRKLYRTHDASAQNPAGATEIEVFI